MIKKSLLNECLKISRNRLLKHPEFLNYPHYSFVILNNKICGMGINQPHEPDRRMGYHKRILKNDFRPKTHSEMNVLSKNNRSLKNGFILINIRLNRSGQPRMSAPCSICRNLLFRFGCKKVYFTHEYGWGKIIF